ncbi:MAG: hypothetical protein FGM14_08300 [Flavobacteriales bacterium]|nr:hypothetical protein [Flavobacteriales bacterium]
MRLTFIFLFFSISSFFAQAFPEGWLGKYAGTMEIINGENIQTVAVDFEMKELQKDSAWSYIMTYKPIGKEAIVKDYIIKRTGASWTFLLDEKDGILIDMRLMGNILYDFYEVNGMFFTSRLSKEKKGLYFELMGGLKSDFRKSSTGISEITEVYSFPPAFVQRVQLKKIK